MVQPMRSCSRRDRIRAAFGPRKTALMQFDDAVQLLYAFRSHGVGRMAWLTILGDIDRPVLADRRFRPTQSLRGGDSLVLDERSVVRGLYRERHTLWNSCKKRAT